MFANVGWGEMMLLVLIGLVVLGPERLPGAIRWTSGALRQARDYLNNATTQIRQDLGPEFDDLREPLGELNKLRGMTPRAAITKHLLDGDESVLKALTEPLDGPPIGSAVPAAPAVPTAAMPLTPPADDDGDGPAKPAAPRFDPDAT
ncbi:Sec-independent protein translocase protein TatB [Mycolicibacterium brumae]|uniref:Sec-independent protein translocase protein TatB n=1 Tax=Mycolicibacterium brumae TaxID=85968 RepID=A0A2G5PEF6_9MYCO|nr:Sec-independent protein translocase protein TatB [Mycolicibacterium brumae]MCV7192108.1 Sec-independent protein translocase subunit TatB [Mycolicibacterium brumae]PIB76702.1 twin-arginine translocase subunit TatB [Mycolicibacterium brumae]RWA20773.1 hypothetical protein MBRU_03680 [Mycolicibacterium brumae DSM 44177]UWW07872.1 Sec-independent protein translocase protein TatB [Mycolicibacterium brumae]